MKPPVFEYRDPRDREEVLALLAEHGSDVSILAGGQSLLPLLNLRLARPEMVIDINRVTGLDGIELTADALRISALTRLRSVERHSALTAAAPAVAFASSCVAHPQIRTRTTIGGNISHADPSSELPGVLAAYDGRVELTSIRGSRWVPWSDYFLTVFTTSREPDEMFTRVEFPLAADTHYVFREISRRPGDYPLSGVCVGLQIEDGVVAQARVSVIAVADRPVRLRRVEAALKGLHPGDREVATAMASLAAEEVPTADDAHGSARFRKGLVRSLITDVLTQWRVAA
jgi:carbon-monoxide dehydrogenase medium subunit